MPRELVLITKQLLYFERYAKELTPDYRMLADPFIVEQVIEPHHSTPSAPGSRRGPVARDARRAGRRPDRARAAATCSSRGSTTASRVELTQAVLQGEAVAVERHDRPRLVHRRRPARHRRPRELPADDASSESFARFTDAERANAAWHFNAWLTSPVHARRAGRAAGHGQARRAGAVDRGEVLRRHPGDRRGPPRRGRTPATSTRSSSSTTRSTTTCGSCSRSIIADPRWDVTYLGMQIIVEGIALAAFGLVHQFTDRAAAEAAHPLRDGRRGPPRRLRRAVARRRLRRDDATAERQRARGLRGRGGVAAARPVPRHRGVGDASASRSTTACSTRSTRRCCSCSSGCSSPRSRRTSARSACCRTASPAASSPSAPWRPPTSNARRLRSGLPAAWRELCPVRATVSVAPSRRPLGLTDACRSVPTVSRATRARPRSIQAARLAGRR